MPEVEEFISHLKRRDYPNETDPPELPKYIKLRKVQKVLKEMGYDWNRIPNTIETWKIVYAKLDSNSPQLVYLYDTAIKEFYYYLYVMGFVPAQFAYYPDFKDGENSLFPWVGAIGSKLIGDFEELDEVLDGLYDGRFHCIGDASNFGRLTFYLMWQGLWLEEIVNLKTSDFLQGYNEEEKRVTNKIFYDGEWHYIDDPRCVKLLLRFRKQRLELEYEKELEYPLYLFPKNGDKDSPISICTLSSKVSRMCRAIKEQGKKDLTSQSIRESGGYYRTYQYMMAHKIPLFYTEQASSILFNELRKSSDVRTVLKKTEFQRFIEYVKVFHDSSI